MTEVTSSRGELLAPPEVRRARLKQLESVIEASWQAAVAVGQALREIQKDGLYHDVGAETFAQYCKSRWGLAESSAYEKIDTAKISDATSGIAGGLPILTERVGRELWPLLRDGGPDRVAQAWTKVSERYKGQRSPTPKEVHEVLVQEGFRPKPGQSTATSGGGRLNTLAEIGKVGEEILITRRRLDWFLTKGIANRKTIGKNTRDKAIEYATWLREMADSLETFGKAE